jgi:hypothetical protein
MGVGHYYFMPQIAQETCPWRMVINKPGSLTTPLWIIERRRYETDTTYYCFESIPDTSPTSNTVGKDH